MQCMRCSLKFITTRLNILQPSHVLYVALTGKKEKVELLILLSYQMNCSCTLRRWWVGIVFCSVRRDFGSTFPLAKAYPCCTKYNIQSQTADFAPVPSPSELDETYASSLILAYSADRLFLPVSSK